MAVAQKAMMNLFPELVVDNFAGGGGASLGIEMAIGRHVDIAINHDPAAISMHQKNHTTTKHYQESVWDIDPIKVTKGWPVSLAWFSPDCKHFSKAKGDVPVEKSIRGLAWVAVKWAATVRPRVIMLENVEEFKTWGPLTPQKDASGRLYKFVTDKEGKRKIVLAKKDEVVPYDKRVMVPDPKQKGRTFRSFINALQAKGYEVEWRELRACDFGAPTIRKRLFIIARCDGLPIIWPEPTYGDPESEEVKNGWRKPWRTAAEIIDWSISCPSIFERKKELSENTLRRIARGIKKFVIENPEPFVVKGKHIIKPLGVDEIKESCQNDDQIISPTLIQMGYGDAEGRRVLDLEKPLGTITAGGNKFAVATATFARKEGGADAKRDSWTCDSSKASLVSAFFAKHYGGNYKGSGANLKKPAPTVTTVDHNALVTSHLLKFRGTCQHGQKVTEPMPTVTAGGNHIGEVRAFLLKYYGDGEELFQKEPSQTARVKELSGLVNIQGEVYQIVDIGMRMLEPRELFRAQGFPDSYIIDFDMNGRRYSKKDQVARCGNSVSPVIPAALVKANLPDVCQEEVPERIGAVAM
ncbi:DNA cytosine methyltransferase [Anaeromusa acidaminophila]|uniref:DNA cytosine methyltransferase n=1 Tax=Anaeromusa acidaminophila TaxID=81464 RepID=UPI000361D7E0|nr:DNA cytosine methyltransferase [Anaeromusa acidaminophila]